MSNSLKKNICSLRGPGALTSELSRSEIEQCIPTELQYACLYWVSHIQWSEPCLYNIEQVHQFLQKDFLHWLEALSLTGKLSDSVRMLTNLESLIVSDPGCCLDIYAKVVIFPSLIKPLTYTRSFTMQNDLFSLIDQSLKSPLSSYIALLSYLRQR
jgi:hypothetical protein